MAASAEDVAPSHLRARYTLHCHQLAAALSANSVSDTVCTALAQLQADGVAQVMSFAAVHHAPLTLSATCPVMRLDCEVFTHHVEGNREMSRVQFEGGLLMFKLHAVERRGGRRRHAASAWWAHRSGLPLVVRVDNARSDVAALLSATLRCRVTALHVEVTVEPRCLRECPATCQGSCGGFLCALASFPHLSDLSVMCAMAVNVDGAEAGLNAVLRVAAQLPISELKLCNLRVLPNLVTLADAQHLRSLTAINCGLRSVKGLARIPHLTFLDVFRNASLTDLTAIADAPRLATVKAWMCGLTSLRGLHSCAALRELFVSSNSELEEVSGVAGAPRLELLDASECRLRSVNGLSRCPALRCVDVSYNNHLEELRGLAGAPRLTCIRARRCALRSVRGLADCPMLRVLDASWNRYFDDISSLAESTSLEEVKVYGCSVSDAAALGPRVRICGALDDSDDHDSEALDS